MALLLTVYAVIKSCVAFGRWLFKGDTALHPTGCHRCKNDKTWLKYSRWHKGQKSGNGSTISQTYQPVFSNQNWSFCLAKWVCVQACGCGPKHRSCSIMNYIKLCYLTADSLVRDGKVGCSSKVFNKECSVAKMYLMCLFSCLNLFKSSHQRQRQTQARFWTLKIIECIPHGVTDVNTWLKYLQWRKGQKIWSGGNNMSNLPESVLQNL